MNKESVIHDFIEHCMMVESKNIDSYIWDLNDVRNEAKKYLSQQKPRTKAEFVKCEFASDKEKAEAFIEGGLRYFTHGPVTGDKEKDTIPVTRLDELLCGNGIYRKVEIEIDERQEFIEAACEIADWNIKKTMGLLFDSGKFKLVDSNG